TLQQQAAQEQLFRSGIGQSMADSISKTGKDVVDRSQKDAQDHAPHYISRSGRVSGGHLTSEQTKQLDSMRQMYDAQKQRYLQSAQQEASEIQKSSENLQNLLNDTPKAGGSKLVPQGTNLYIRNYEPVKPAPKKGK